MLSTTPLLCAISLALASHTWAETYANDTHAQFLNTCHKISEEISCASQVFFPSDPQYTSHIFHFALSSIENSTCSVEPGSAEDVSKILKILGSSRTPFAVKGGGHSVNPGFSSTPGVQISMSRFNDTKVDLENETVEIGPGLTWDQVYETLSPTGVNVVGGRVSDVGVAGLLLGGGYSYLTNQYGLSIDNVAGYELVLPNGTIKDVTSEDEDLWFGLRGGLNNFGVVTKFTLKSHPQTDVWGGMLLYTRDKFDQIKEALIQFERKTDPKAAAMVSVSYIWGQVLATVYYFYDAPTHPAGVFDDFLAIQHLQGNVSTMSYSDLITANSQAFFSITRDYYEAVAITQSSPAVFDAFVNNTEFWGKRLFALDSTSIFASVFEPFDRDLFSHGSPSAYPPDRSHTVFPSMLVATWANASLDETILDMLRDGAKTIRDVALADGQDVSHGPLYVNYALSDTPLEYMYGENVARLRKIKAEIDPEKVMDLAGGFKF